MGKYSSTLWLAVGVAVVASGCTLYGWGSNGFGQFGDGTTTKRAVPTVIGEDLGSSVDPIDDWLSVSAGSTHTQGLRDI
jgi:alpha-tubulin suppressor-like RCC1 family protein